MIKRVCKGSALSEYAIVIALIAIPVIAGFFYVGKTIVANLQNLYNGLQGSSQQAFISSSNATGETSANPRSAISTETGSNVSVVNNNGSLTIDFGKYVLAGIPEDFQKEVITSGTGRGTELLATLMMQLSDQLKEEGLTEQAEEVKKLAVTGHNIAGMEKLLEEKVKQGDCGEDRQCYVDFAESNPIPPNFDTTYTPFNGCDEVTFAGRLGNARFCTDNPSDTKCQEIIVPRMSQAMFYIQTFDKVLADPKISHEAKGLIQELTWSIGALGEEFYAASAYVADTNPIPEVDYRDTLTAEVSTFMQPGDGSAQAGLDNFINNKASTLTNLDASLICASANYQDTGVSCH